MRQQGTQMQVIKQQLSGRGNLVRGTADFRGESNPVSFWISELNSPSIHSASARRLVFHALSTPAPVRTWAPHAACTPQPLSKWPGPDLLENDKYLFISSESVGTTSGLSASSEEALKSSSSRRRVVWFPCELQGSADAPSLDYLSERLLTPRAVKHMTRH
ncbi:unnamed protein product [Boreogadus saida]